MPQHDVYPAPDGRGYLLDVQSDILEVLGSRVVVPLVPEGAAPVPSRGLNPLVEIGGERHVMVTQTLSAVPASALRGPVMNLSGRSAEITRALDMLVQGF